MARISTAPPPNSSRSPPTSSAAPPAPPHSSPKRSSPASCKPCLEPSTNWGIDKSSASTSSSASSSSSTSAACSPSKRSSASSAPPRPPQPRAPHPPLHIKVLIERQQLRISIRPHHSRLRADAGHPATCSSTRSTAACRVCSSGADRRAHRRPGRKCGCPTFASAFGR